MSSDGPTPKAKIQQILAVAAILPGQSPDQQSHNSSQQHAQAQPQLQQTQAALQQAPGYSMNPQAQQPQVSPQNIQASSMLPEFQQGQVQPHQMDPQFQQGQVQPQQMNTQFQPGQAQTQQMNAQFQQGQPQVRKEPSQVQQAPALAHGTGPSDLIDFGQISHSNAVPAPAPQYQQSMASHDPPVGLQEPLEPALGPPIVRLDTNTEEIDVFVDAPVQKH